jgi:hypothetical protein
LERVCELGGFAAAVLYQHCNVHEEGPANGINKASQWLGPALVPEAKASLSWAALSQNCHTKVTPIANNCPTFPPFRGRCLNRGISMASTATHSHAATFVRPNLDAGPHIGSVLLIIGSLLAVGLLYTAYSLYVDVADAQVPTRTLVPFLLLGVALLIALGFEFVNGFHDTANAVATVIYTHSLNPQFAVIWSGTWNFLGVLFSSGAVAFGIISLLPVELILQVGSSAGFAMVFALLIAAIIWNVGTWYFGLPASSSHTLIGSIIGVGVANQLMRMADGTSGVDWSQAWKVGQSLLLSPLVGFVCAALLLLVVKMLVRNPELYRAPQGNRAPRFVASWCSPARG